MQAVGSVLDIFKSILSVQIQGLSHEAWRVFGHRTLRDLGGFLEAEGHTPIRVGVLGLDRSEATAVRFKTDGMQYSDRTLRSRLEHILPDLEKGAVLGLPYEVDGRPYHLELNILEHEADADRIRAIARVTGENVDERGMAVIPALFSILPPDVELSVVADMRSARALCSWYHRTNCESVAMARSAGTDVARASPPWGVLEWDSSPHGIGQNLRLLNGIISDQVVDISQTLKKIFPRWRRAGWLLNEIPPRLNETIYAEQLRILKQFKASLMEVDPARWHFTPFDLCSFPEGDYKRAFAFDMMNAAIFDSGKYPEDYTQLVFGIHRKEY